MYAHRLCHELPEVLPPWVQASAFDESARVFLHQVALFAPTLEAVWIGRIHVMKESRTIQPVIRVVRGVGNAAAYHRATLDNRDRQRVRGCPYELNRSARPGESATNYRYARGHGSLRVHGRCVDIRPGET
jgi:hypothetical protein